MKILFVRHGESVDDLTDQYGGWGDFELTPKGKIQLAETAEKISKLDAKFEIILHSPLERAEDSARIIANTLSIPAVEFVYLKEKNGYGLLSGMNKEEAKRNYPELVKMMEDGYTPGSEPTEEFENRVKMSLEIMKKMEYENMIAVTHGGYLVKLVEILFGKELKEKADGGFILIDFGKEKPEVVLKDGVEF